jgi:hypothetical protein
MRIAGVYVNICSGVFHSRPPQLAVYAGRNRIFSPESPSLRQPQPDVLNAEHVSASVLNALSWIASRLRPGFRVGRLILLVDDSSHFVHIPSPPKPEYITNWVSELINGMVKGSPDLKFDYLDVLTVVLDNDPVDQVSRSSTSSFRNRVILAQSEHCENIGSDLAAADLRLSVLSFCQIDFFFCDPFARHRLNFATFECYPRAALMPPVEASFPCFACQDLSKIAEDLRGKVVVFEAQWMLSWNDGHFALAKLRQQFDADLLENCAFSPGRFVNRLLFKMPNLLKVAQGGNPASDWTFSRKAPSPVVMHLTKLAALDGPDHILFSEQLYEKSGARAVIPAILDSLGRPQLTLEVVQIVDSTMQRLISLVSVGDVRILPADRQRSLYPRPLFDQLLADLAKTIEEFASCSREHAALWTAFQQHLAYYKVIRGGAH